MRALISAIISALKSAFACGLAVLSAPFRMFGGGGGQGMPPEIPMPQPYVDKPAPRDMTAVYDEIARILMTWAADSIIADEPVPVPPKLPREFREWLPGLSRDECDKLMEADKMAVSAHVRGLFAIPGVRKVMPLRAVVWPPEAPIEESPGFAAIAKLERDGRPAA
ncbi:hypothetical protein BF49_2550 [Bradyrhizobium sp.]|nr:hypothetical protein BF49_2550 [Bradyrhizobium sp.]